MKIDYKYIIGIALALLSACAKELPAPVPSVGEADNAIVLKAGISEGASGVQTKAYNPEANHGSHFKFTKVGTALTLRVDGVWKDKANGYRLPHGEVTSEVASQITTATIGSVVANTNEKHNDVNFAPDQQLYWDDYGSADPANIDVPRGTATAGTGGRDKGLDIFAVAVDGEKTAPVVSSWTALTWNVGEVSDDAINQTSGWAAKDLLTSNNVKKTDDEDTNNPYKFDDRDSGKLLEFTHAMTKVTVNLTANKGFPGYPSGAENAKFQAEPKVTLLGFNYTGKVNVETKISTATNADGTDSTPENSARANFKAHRESSSAWAAAHKVSYTALVFPGNQFSDATKILKIEADDNIYYVDATKINVANQETNNTFEQAKEYIFNITINKTEIKVTATVKDWITVEAEEVAPVINVNTSYSSDTGATPSGFTSFSFYRSASDPYASTPVTNKLVGYSNSSDLIENDCYKPEGVPTGTANQATKWTFSQILYWPSHKTHYHFRGVWPTTVNTADASYDWQHPRVKMNSTSDAQVIGIKNVAYNGGSFPSDLLIGAPEFTDANRNCNNEDHDHIDQSEYGICATEGLITLNFQYIMSQVEVVLSTSAEGSIDYVNIGANTVVEIVNVAKNGYVKLGDRTVVPSAQETSYTLDPKPTDGLEGDVLVLAQRTRHSAIVPQTLTFSEAGASTNVRFKITVTNNDETQDIYYADIKPILKNDKSGPVAPNGRWESGVHYKYSLKLTKTEIKVTATITDWVTVNASEDVWF